MQVEREARGGEGAGVRTARLEGELEPEAREHPENDCLLCKGAHLWPEGGAGRLVIRFPAQTSVVFCSRKPLSYSGRLPLQCLFQVDYTL